MEIVNENGFSYLCVTILSTLKKVEKRSKAFIQKLAKKAHKIIIAKEKYIKQALNRAMKFQCC